MTNIAIVKTDARIQRCAIANPFEHYKPEEERNVKKFEVKENNALKQLIGALQHPSYGDFRNSGFYSDTTTEMYRQACSLTSKLKYSSTDITNLSIVLATLKYEKRNSDLNEKPGLFLSALINHCKEDNFTIITEYLEQSLYHLGYENTKNIVVVGNVHNIAYRMKCGTITVKGDEIGESSVCQMKSGRVIIEGNVSRAIGRGMQGGTVIVKGNIRSEPGKCLMGGTIIIEGNCTTGYAGAGMESGLVVIKGNAGDYAGHSMKGGILIVNGNAGHHVGGDSSHQEEHNMNGGSIFLEGKYGSLGGGIKGGNIFHKGKQIVKNGKVLI